MSGAATKSSGLLKSLRIQPSDVVTLASWGIAAGAGALYLVQPFDWIKKQLFPKPEPQPQQ